MGLVWPCTVDSCHELIVHVLICADPGLVYRRSVLPVVSPVQIEASATLSLHFRVTFTMQYL